MKNREQILYPMHGADANVIRIEPWIPPKSAYDVFQGYTLSRSTPDGSADRDVQFAVRTADMDEDLMRVHSYSEGYFAATWWSTIPLEEFLIHAEAYFQNLNHLFTQETSRKFGVFTSFRDPEFYEFERPLTLTELQVGGVFLGDEDYPLGLFRIDTQVGDLTYEPANECVGLIATLNPSDPERPLRAMGEFVSQTQELLTPQVVAKVLRDLPCRKAA